MPRRCAAGNDVVFETLSGRIGEEFIEACVIASQFANWRGNPPKFRRKIQAKLKKCKNNVK